jgi:hypothetical protein
VSLTLRNYQIQGMADIRARFSAGPGAKARGYKRGRMFYRLQELRVGGGAA